MIVAISIGAVGVPVGDVWGIVLHHATGAGAAPSDPALDQIVWNFRTPRVVLAALAGAGLAVSGAVLQTVAKTPRGTTAEPRACARVMPRSRRGHHP